jgi:hypothetical protein
MTKEEKVNGKLRHRYLDSSHENLGVIQDDVNRRMQPFADVRERRFNKSDEVITASMDM